MEIWRYGDERMSYTVHYFLTNPTLNVLIFLIWFKKPTAKSLHNSTPEILKDIKYENERMLQFIIFLQNQP